MPLKITRASDPIHVSTIVTTIYSPPGVGKSTLGFTAEKPLLLDFDRGVHRTKNRSDCAIMETWADAANLTGDDLKPFKTVVLDTAGRALDMLTIDIINIDPKAGRGGALTLPGYGTLKSRFIAWLKLVRSFGLDVVLLVHMDEQRKGDELIERLDMQGASKGEVYKVSDLMGRLYYEKGKRMINFNPTDVAFGKNPGLLPVQEVPDYKVAPDFLATLIAQTKLELNKMSDQQKDASVTLAAWQEKIDEAAVAADFDALVTSARAESEPNRGNIGKMIVKAAKAEGLAYDKATEKFGPAKDKAAKKAT